MKRIIIAGGIVVVALVLGLIAWSVFRSQGTAPAAISGSGSSAGNGTPGSLTPIYQSPTSTMLTLGTAHGSVVVKNFYIGALGADEEFIVMAKNGAYEITYDTNTNAFYLYLTQGPVATVQPQAEDAFLGILGVTTSDACKLDVAVSVDATVDANVAGRSSALSFCSAAYSN